MENLLLSPQSIAADIDQAVLEIASLTEGQYVTNPSSYADQIAFLAEHGEIQMGEELPWSNDVQKLRGGELSVWAGVNGHGKSLILGQAMLWRMNNQKVVIASLEMKPKETLWRMIKQYAGCVPCRDFALDVLAKFEGRLWIYDQLDSIASDRVIGLIHYAKKHIGADHIVIDSMSKCGMGQENYDKQMAFTDKLQWAAKHHDIHVHLVCHVRKGDKEGNKISKFDIKGSGAIADLTDNIFLVSRNKQREQAKARRDKQTPQKDDEKILQQADVYLDIPKNRHGGKEGVIPLYFDPKSLQYKTRETTQAMCAPF